ncbi:hypothetical protein MCANUFG4_02201 [Mycoplasmopsis canis UFG4]|uniref:DUF1410 domain-containing protein n=1 Tax=Mycoplasmopsis canis UFG4 TaxID=1131455 RepID=I1A5T6_9BACT|nr:DUF1410 domain-containing protein [Mycoplasmopsis canis]EIE41857.1 hypothetical protein MCANUFG4_02201 [Mycoplasmopsis canis UFG4]
MTVKNLPDEFKKKKRRRKAALLLFPLLISGTVAASLAGLLLYQNLNKDNKNSYLGYYSYNENGDIKLEVYVSKEALNDIEDKKLMGIFVDENGVEYYLESTISEHGLISFDTSVLPTPGFYTLNKISKSKNSKDVIVSESNLPKELLTPIRKPSVIGDISTKANTIEKVINWNVNPGLANRTLRLEIQNEEGKIVELELKVDKSSNLSIDTSKLEYGHKWEIKKVIDIDKNNPNPVINLNDVDKKLKTIDLRDYSNNFGVNENGDVIISSKISNVNDKTNIVAVFTDKNGNEYTVDGTLDNNGNAIFDTSLLPSEGEFVLNKIVNKDNNETLKAIMI